MMKKKRSSISTNVRPNGTTWKLGFYFLFILVFFSKSLFAVSAKISTEEVLDASNIAAQQHPVAAIHIAEGTTVYGSDLISEITAPSPSSAVKKQKKRVSKAKVIPLTKKNVQPENKYKKPETKVLLSNHPLNNSFNVSKHSIEVGTITVNNTLKSVLHHTYLDFKITTLSFCNNSLFKYSILFIKEITDRYCFTRPPPFA